MTRYWRACGPLLGSARFASRAWARLRHLCATRLWRSALGDLGDGSLVQAGVLIEIPRRVRVGRGCLITAGALLTSELPDGTLELRDGVQINRDARLDHTGGLILCEGALVSEGATLMTHDHGHDPHSAPQPIAMTVGREAWIGAHAIILPGVRSIGDGAVIGAAAVVTRDVPPHAIVVGNPARIVGTRVRTDEGARAGTPAADDTLAGRGPSAAHHDLLERKAG